MKVIKSRLSITDWPKRCTCEKCGAELEYIPEDVYVGWGGLEYVTCPECECEIMVGESVRKVKPTWPLTFSHISKEDGAKDIFEEAIDEMVDEVAEAMQSNKRDWDFTMRATGDTMVIGLKNEDGISVYVTKDYWEDTIFND